MLVSLNGYVIRLQNLLIVGLLTIDETGLVAVTLTERTWPTSSFEGNSSVTI